MEKQLKIVKKYVGDAADKISHTVSPMVATGRWLKEQYPDAVTVFIGPCIAKKDEAEQYLGIPNLGAVPFIENK